MRSNIFAFTLHTETELDDNSVVFSTDGNIVGKILHKRLPYKSNLYSYDVESTKDTFEKLKNGEVRLYGIENYSMDNCSTWYTHKED